jgi:hypothetical protein
MGKDPQAYKMSSTPYIYLVKEGVTHLSPGPMLLAPVGKIGVCPAIGCLHKKKDGLVVVPKCGMASV